MIRPTTRAGTGFEGGTAARPCMGAEAGSDSDDAGSESMTASGSDGASAGGAAERTVGGVAVQAATEDGVRRVEVVVSHADGGNSGMIWTVGILLVVGVGAAAMLLTGDGVGVGSNGYGEPPCADGIDNDGGGKKDGNDPDCYANPEVWEGYDPNRQETNPANDPPG